MHSESESDESISEFERNLRVLLLDLHIGNESTEVDQPLGTRRSERAKKPSFHFTEDAGFVAVPPKEEDFEGRPLGRYNRQTSTD